MPTKNTPSSVECRRMLPGLVSENKISKAAALKAGGEAKWHKSPKIRDSAQWVTLSHFKK